MTWHRHRPWGTDFQISSKQSSGSCVPQWNAYTDQIKRAFLLKHWTLNAEFESSCKMERRMTHTARQIQRNATSRLPARCELPSLGVTRAVRFFM